MEKNLAICIADLTGYTAMTDVHGGSSAASMVRRYVELVEESLRGSSRLVQQIGDQVVFVSESPDDVARTACALVAAVESEHHFLSIHAGIHYGPVIEQDGSFFGSTINIASRIMNIAGRGQVLGSLAFVDLVNREDFSFKRVGSYKFKNLMQETEVHELVMGENRNSFLEVDPVCRMTINPEKSLYHHTFEGKEFHFCSSHCLEVFKANPEAILQQ